MLRLLNNRLYRINYWLDQHEMTKFFIMLLLVGGSNASLYIFNNPIYGIIGLTLLCIFAIVRVKFQKKDWLFIKTLYDVPKVNEIIIIEDTFFWDGGFKRYINLSDPSRKPWWYTIKKGTEWYLFEIEDLNGDWRLTFAQENKTEIIDIGYFESRKYWKTKSNIRDEKLKSIGI